MHMTPAMRKVTLRLLACVRTRSDDHTYAAYLLDRVSSHLRKTNRAREAKIVYRAARLAKRSVQPTHQVTY